MAAEGEDEPLAKVLKAIREDGRQRRADEERRHAELKETLANSRMGFRSGVRSDDVLRKLNFLGFADLPYSFTISSYR